MSDLPVRVVSIASRLLSPDRREWGDAMVAELTHVPGGPARWEFALGCLRAAILAPRPNERAPSTGIAVTFLAGVAGCIATTAYVFTTWPHAAESVSRGTGLWFAVALVAYVWIALWPPGVLVARSDAVRLGMKAGVGLFVIGSLERWVIDTALPPSQSDGPVLLFFAATVVGTFFVTAYVAARADRSVAAGVTGALWVGLVCSLLAFNADLIALLAGFNLEAHMRNVVVSKDPGITAAAYMSTHIGEHLAASMDTLRRLPFVAFGFGLIGGLLGARARPKSRSLAG